MTSSTIENKLWRDDGVIQRVGNEIVLADDFQFVDWRDRGNRRFTVEVERRQVEKNGFSRAACQERTGGRITSKILSALG